MFRAPGLALGLLLLSSPAFAHIDLLFPPPRLAGTTGGNALKLGPCGQPMGENGRTATVTEFAPGETITIEVNEYIPHPGYYRVAFDVDGDDDFPIREDMDSIDRANDDSEQVHPVGDVVLLYDFEKAGSLQVTLPNVQCDNCTLQVIQFMYDKIGNSRDDEYYFQCADLRLVGDTTEVPPADSDDVDTPDPGSNDSDDLTEQTATEDVSSTGTAGSDTSAEASDGTDNGETSGEDPLVPAPEPSVTPGAGETDDTTGTPGDPPTPPATVEPAPAVAPTAPASSSPGSSTGAGSTATAAPATAAPPATVAPTGSVPTDSTASAPSDSGDGGCAVTRHASDSATGWIWLLFASALLWRRARD